MIERLIISLAAAVNSRTLYPANHPRVILAVRQVITTLQSLIEEKKLESATFLIVGDDLVFEQQPLRKGGLSERQFVQLMRRPRIERLTLASGLTEEETHAFISALATGAVPQASPHIVLGRVEVNLDEGNGATEMRELTPERLDVVREAFRTFRQDGALPLGQMEELVWSFIDSLSRTTRAVLPLAKLKEHDEYTFIHCVNVSMLVLAQARSFGIQGALLHAFGMSGLLHDIGKLMVPLEVLNFPV